ncbi:MAG: helix-turn-helix domain-containing protein [Candidatus Peribacteraceae bacterium]
MLLQFLQSCKITDKEQKVFLKVLSLGSQPASSIARQLELPRNTVRSILDSLVERGFLVRTRRASTQYYAVETLENIERMLEHRAEKASEELRFQQEALKASRSELLSWTRSGSRPTITFYEGLSGLEKVYEDTLTATQLRSWASYDALFEILPDYFNTYFKRRAKKGIHMTSIHPDTPKARIGQSKDRAELRTSALVPADRFHFTPEIQVYDNKINITSWKEKLGIIIESKEIAEALKAIFDLSFEAAVGYGKVTQGYKKKRK